MIDSVIKLTFFGQLQAQRSFVRSVASFACLCDALALLSSQSPLLYSTFNNTNFVKATAQYQNRKIVCQ